MKNILQNTWALLNSLERKRFTSLVIFDILISIIDILSLALLLWIVRFYIEPGNSSLPSFLPAWMSDKDSVSLIALFFILFALKNIAGFFVNRAHYRFISEVAVRLSGNNLSEYQHAAYEEFVNKDSSLHIRRIGFQPFEFCQYILSGIQQIITQGCLVILTVLAIIFFDAKLFLLLLLVLLPPVVLVFFLVKKKLQAAKKSIQTSNEHSFRHLLDALKGYVEGNIYNRNDFFLSRFIQSRKRFSKALFDSLAIQSLPSRIIEIFAILGLFILIAIAKWSGSNDSSSLLTIGALIAAAYKIIPGMVRIINTSGQMRAYQFSVTDLQKDRPGKKSSTPTPATLHSLQLKDIFFSYPGLPVLSGFDLALNKGEFIGITGQSGKGKTTVLNILLGFLNPSGGEMHINGMKVNNEQLRSYWPSIAYVRQQSFFIHDSLLRNITFQENGHDAAKLQYALQVSGLDSFIAQFPEGLDKMIMENGKNISGGQQQRIAIARALYKDADLILLDEPFNELDEASEKAMLDHFSQLARQGKMIVLITHNQKSLGYCAKIISLDEQG